MTTNKPKLSIILVTWDRRDELKKLLEKLDDQSIRNQCQLIIVDNGSIDGTLEMLRAWPKPLMLIKNSKNVGPAIGRNQGIKKADAEYCCFIDTDAWPVETDILERMVSHLDANPKSCGASCFIYLNEEKTEVFCKGCYFNENGHFDPERTFNQHEDPDYLTTCFAVYRRGDLVRGKGFDPYYGYGIEDGDLGMTVKKLTGGKYHVDPERSIIHEMSMAGREHHWSAFNQKFCYLEWNRQYFLVKHYGPIYFLRKAIEIGKNRGFLESWYKHPITKWQKIKALGLYPLATLLMMPYITVQHMKNHLMQASVSSDQVEVIVPQPQAKPQPAAAEPKANDKPAETTGEFSYSAFDEEKK